MTANLFSAQMAVHSWDQRQIDIPSISAWIDAGGLAESHDANVSALKSAKRFISEVVRELQPGERDELFEALFFRNVVQRQIDEKDGKHSTPVSAFCSRFDSRKKSDLFRDYVARLVGM